VSRLVAAFVLAAALLGAGCGDDRQVREWRAEDHAQPQAGAADTRTAPDGTPAAFDEVAAVASLFRVRCASCHGEVGRGDGLGIPQGAQVRDLSDPEWQASVTDAEIAAVIAGGRGLMPRFDDSINARGISGLVTHIRGFAAE
jgi:mono/diheme cytochrome c family protein